MSLHTEHLKWLIGPEGHQSILTAMNDAAEWRKHSKRLPADRAALVAEQAELRQRAAAKFPLHDQMFFTRIGLQQATDAMIATYKANRFRGHAVVADYCCGIGGDLIHFAQVSEACGFDLDPDRVLLANANCKAAGVNATARVADVCALDTRDVSAWHIDPDRRATGNRTVRIDAFQPSAEAITRMLQRNVNGAIKLAPATPTDDLEWATDVDLEWIGHSRSCQQLVAWFGGLVQHANQRVATVIDNQGNTISFASVDESAPAAEEVGAFVFEPHPTILAAGLAGAISNRLNLQTLIPGGGYLTAATLVDSKDDAARFLTAFRVLESDSFRPKRIRKRLQELNAGIVEVKQRGVKVDLATLQRQWRGSGESNLTVLITRRGKSMIAIIAERVV
ncbi:MAG: hypothetical protein KDB27_13745 [Planctomycetales bacterium]|nr:hypothetical protein [Planctomycetales bacterium]